MKLLKNSRTQLEQIILSKGVGSNMYIYHMVPNNLLGTNLIPLNILKEINKDLYYQYKQKYLDNPDRIKLLQRTIPKLNSLWNDVVHTSTIHPHVIYKTLKGIGAIGNSNPIDKLFYKIPINIITNEAVIYR